MDLSDTDEESRLKGFEGFSEAYITKSNKIKEEQGDENGVNGFKMYTKNKEWLLSCNE